MGFEVAARTERCAVEGELLVELTKHGVMVSNSERTVNGQFVFVPVLSRSWPRISAVFSDAAPTTRKMECGA